MFGIVNHDLLFSVLTEWHHRNVLPTELAINSDVLPEGPSSL